MLAVDRLLELADGARLEPNAVAELAPGMEPLVRRRVDEIEVLDPVVGLDLVLVMHLHAPRDWPVVLLPNEVMLHSETTRCRVVSPHIALIGDVPLSAW